MAKSKKFPRLIHVTFENDSRNDPPYHVVQEDGVFGVEEPGKEIAIYQLVKRGRVSIIKKFQDSK